MSDKPYIPALSSLPVPIEDDLEDDDSREGLTGDGEISLTIDISHWDWDPSRGKLIDSVTRLDLLVDGEPNPEIARIKGIPVEPE